MKNAAAVLLLAAIAFAPAAANAASPPIDQETNVALSSVGAYATASSTNMLSCIPVGFLHDACTSPYSPMLAINGERAGAGWSASGGWADATPDDFRDDWLAVNFYGTKLIDRVAVYTLQDDWQHPVEPTDAMTFSQYGIQDFEIDIWDGAQQSWTPVATVSGNSLVKRTVSFDPVRTTAIRVKVTRALAAVARITEVEAWGVPDAPVPVLPGALNLAVDSRGATVMASSTFGPGFEASNAIRDTDGVSVPLGDIEPSGMDWGQAGGWADGTPDQYPDWLEVRLPAIQAIDRVRVTTLRDQYTILSGPQTFDRITKYGIVDFSIQAWNGADWLTVASVTGNDRPARTLSFPAIATDRVRIVVTKALGSLSRITGFQVYPAGTEAGGRVNVAADAQGSLATASSTFSADFPVDSINDGQASGRNWAAGGGWASAPDDSAPYVDIALHGLHTLDSVVVYTVQDAWQNPVNNDGTLTFSQYGITAYQVQAWNGSAWVTLANVSGNNHVKSTVTFTPYTTDRIRIVPTAWLAGVARIVEIEAWGTPGPQSGRANVAISGMGSVASASSTFSSLFPASSVINGERAGKLWGDGGGWADGTFAMSPDSVTVDFKTLRGIGSIDVYTVQDNYQAPAEPTPGLTFSTYGISDYIVEAQLPDNSWVTVGSVVSNNLVKRTFTFMPITARAIRVTVTNPSMYLSRITEIEAWEPVAASCPANAPAVTGFNLQYNNPAIAGNASGSVSDAPLPPLSTNSAVAQLAQTTTSPIGATVEMAISPCQGVIDSNAGACYTTAVDPIMLSLRWTASLASQAPGVCLIDPNQTYYLNVRYTYSPSQCAFAPCGYAIEATYGP